ncbi:MAG: hypothetical protein M1812_002575 [Candelaria pacifica]|nr:MAG: hypothetical protein M1812_002575 [Candelaria pacifica]
MSTLTFPTSSQTPLYPYLPSNPPSPSPLPHITLTYATSLDSSLSLSPGLQTHLSGPLSKAMTHYLRSKHSAILIGVGTAIADNPGLNCRLENVGLREQPRPIVVDPNRRWRFEGEERVLRNWREGRGKGLVVISKKGGEERDLVLEGNGGEVWEVEGGEEGKIAWEEIFRCCKGRGVDSVMVEGGGMVVNELLRRENLWMVGSLIVTIAPTYLGRGGVVVSPEGRIDEQGRPVAALRLGDVRWLPMGEDVVLCGKPQIIEQAL